MEVWADIEQLKDEKEKEFGADDCIQQEMVIEKIKCGIMV